MGGFMTLLAFAFLGFLAFCIHFFFKSLQFVIQAINLYKKMIEREEAILQVLVDIRDNTKLFQGHSDGYSKIIAPSVNMLEKSTKCPECNYIFRGEYDREGWWCPNCNKVRYDDVREKNDSRPHTAVKPTPQPITQPMVCKHCNAKLSSGDEFCPNCGKSIKS